MAATVTDVSLALLFYHRAAMDYYEELVEVAAEREEEDECEEVIAGQRHVREVSVVSRDGFSVESEFQLNPAYPMQFGTLIPNIVFISNFKVIFKVKSRIKILSPRFFLYRSSDVVSDGRIR